MKKIFIVILLSLLLTIVISPVRGIPTYGFRISYFSEFISFFLLFLYLQKKYKTDLTLGKICLSMLAGYLILDLPIRLPDWEHTLISLPDFIFQISGILLAYIACKFLPNAKYIPFLAGLSMCIFMAFKGFELHCNKLNFGHFTPETNEPYALPVHFRTLQGDTVTFNKQEKYILFYCWNEYCGSCIKSFPKLRELYKTAPEHIEIYAVHWPLKDGSFSEQAMKWAKSIQVPVLLATKSQMDITCVPTVIILDLLRERMLFKGSIENAEKYIYKISD